MDHEFTHGAQLTQLQPLLYTGDFLDSVNTGLVLYGVDGRILDVNSAAETLLGASAKDLAGKSSAELCWNGVHEDGTAFPADQHPVEVALRTGEVNSDVVMGIDIPDRRRRWLSIDTWPIILEGQLRGVVSAFDDVTLRLQQYHSLALLTNVNRLVMSASDESASLQQLCGALVEHGRYALAYVAYPSGHDSRGVDITHSAGKVDYLFDGMVSWSGDEAIGLGPTGTALRTGTTQVTKDFAHAAGFEPWRARAATFGLGSSVAIPFAPGERLAVLAVYDSHAFTFDEATVAGLEEIVKEVEFGIVHVRVLEQLSAALRGTIAVLARITESRDPYTAGHQLHVGSLAAAISMRLGLDAGEVELIRLSGEVHDIGKTAIPAEILTKPGRLSPLEYELVKRHAQIGADILAGAALPWPIAEVALQHHERLDGSGYPSALRAGDIILPARIIAVAEVVEAMTQHRPYRAGLGIERALAEVEGGSGTRFDADAVSACVSVFEEGYTLPA